MTARRRESADQPAATAPSAGRSLLGGLAERLASCSARQRAIGLYALVLAALVALSVVLLAPLSLSPSTTVPDLLDSLHNMWVWGDNINRMGAERSWFDAGIYFPEKNVIAFSEFQPLNTLLFYPFFRWLDAPVLGHNVILLTSFVLTGFFSFLIALEVCRRPALALLAATAFTFLGYRFAHLHHAQLLTFQWVAIPFYLLMRYLKKPSTLTLALFGGFFFLQVASIGYNTTFLLMLVGGYWLVTLRGRPWRRQLRGVHGRSLLVMTAAVIASVPFYLPYVRAAASGNTRPLEEQAGYGLDLLLFIAAPINNYVYGDATAPIRAFHTGPAAVFAGFGILVFLVVGFYGQWKTRAHHTAAPHDDSAPPGTDAEVVLFLTVMAGLFLLLALGPVIKLENQPILPSPAALLYRYVPLLWALRFIPNFIQPLVFCATLLAAMGAARLPRFRRRRQGLLLCSALGLIIVLEQVPVVPTVPAPPHGPDLPVVYRWLARQPDGPVIELPTPLRFRAEDRYWNLAFQYMFYSIHHRKPIVNGISGFYPQSLKDTYRAMRDFPSSQSVRRLFDIGAQYVVVHLDLTHDARRIVAEAAEVSSLEEIYRDEKAVIYRLVGEPPQVADPVTTLKPEQTSMSPRLQGSDCADLQFRMTGHKFDREVKAGGTLRGEVSLVNAGKLIWIANNSDHDPPGWGEVRLGLRSWVREDGFVPKMPDRPKVDLHARAHLERNVAPGEASRVTISAPAPREAGRYTLRLNLVDELLCWFPQRDVEVVVTVR